MTDRQHTTLKMSLVPLFILLALIGGAGFLLLQGDIKLPKFNQGPQLRRLDGFSTVVYTDKNLEKKRLIIKSEKELTDFLNYVDSTGITTLKEPINFDREYLIGVSSETHNETGHQTKIKKIYKSKDNKTLLVSVEETEKGQYCTVENDPNVTVDLVAISKTNLNFDFERIKKIDECDKPSTTNESSEPAK